MTKEELMRKAIELSMRNVAARGNLSEPSLPATAKSSLREEKTDKVEY